MNAIPILIVDDEDTLCEMIRQFLTENGFFNLTTVCDGAKAMGLLRTEDFKCVMLNVGMPEPNGIKVLQYIKKYFPNIKVIMTSGYYYEGVELHLEQLGAATFLRKPFTSEQLISSLNNALNLQ